MKRAFAITAIALDVVLLCTVWWVLVALLAVGTVLVVAAGWAMHRYPEEMTP